FARQWIDHGHPCGAGWSNVRYKDRISEIASDKYGIGISKLLDRQVGPVVRDRDFVILDFAIRRQASEVEVALRAVAETGKRDASFCGGRDGKSQDVRSWIERSAGEDAISRFGPTSIASKINPGVEASRQRSDHANSGS